jgi:GAF domain-containing protein
MSFSAPALSGSKPEQYAELLGQARALIGDERDAVANMANISALIFTQLGGLNWAGFYLMKGGELVLGPFQGKPACIRIPVGRGVCGTAAASHETQVVPDVHAFPGHIACDADSRSEIVVPLIQGDRLIGVLDLDSPSPARFDEADRAGLEALGGLLIASSDWGD